MGKKVFLLKLGLTYPSARARQWKKKSMLVSYGLAKDWEEKEYGTVFQRF